MSQNKSQTRINQQIRNMLKQPLPYLTATPLQNDIYTWHFTIQGPQNSDFHEGLYHGQILLPFEYPFKPPDMIFMNKNGRFQVNTKICLTITQYHPQDWNPSWTVRTMLQAVISLFNEKVIGIGYQQGSKQMRKQLARKSHMFKCEKCGVLKDVLKPREPMKQEQSQQKIQLSKDKISNQGNLQKRNKQDQDYIEKIMRLAKKQGNNKSQDIMFKRNDLEQKTQSKNYKISEQKFQQIKNSNKVQQNRANKIRQNKKTNKQKIKSLKNNKKIVQKQQSSQYQQQKQTMPIYKFKPFNNDSIALDNKIYHNCNKLLDIYKKVKITQLK